MNTEQLMLYTDRKFMFYFLSAIISLGCKSIRKIDEKLNPEKSDPEKSAHEEAGQEKTAQKKTGQEKTGQKKSRYENLASLLEYDCIGLKNEFGLSEKQAAEIISRKNNIEEIFEEYKTLEESGIRMVLYDEEDFPEKLRYINQPPAFLFVKGSLPRPANPSVAIVGSRAATNYGSSVAEFFAQSLAEEGVDIISGMAIGIDTAAHKGALKSDSGKTYAVLGGGVNIVYPKENYYLYEMMANENRGGVISEMAPGVPALSRNFPMRNRIISGLADVVLVVEAREKSGSLITVEYATDQGRDVMAVPGRITDPMSRGTNELIAAGARIANSPEDVLDNLNIVVHGEVTLPDKNINLLDNTEKMVYITLDSTPKHIDDIVEETNLTHQEVTEALVELELKGLINQVSSNFYGK